MVAESVLVSGYTAKELGIYSAAHPGIDVIRHCLRAHMRQLVASGTNWFVISGQSGTELWAGEMVFLLKREEGIAVHLAVLPPFLDQEKRYPAWMKDLYQSIIERADFTQPISNHPYQQPRQLKQKNEFLIRHTDGLLLLWDEEKPGTPNYYMSSAKKKAEQTDYPVWTLDRYDLEVAEEDMRAQSPDYWDEQ